MKRVASSSRHLVLSHLGLAHILLVEIIPLLITCPNFLDFKLFYILLLTLGLVEIDIVHTIYLSRLGFEGSMFSYSAIARELCFPKQHYESIVPKNQALICLVHHFFRKYCIMTSIYRQCNVFDVILNDKGCNSVEQNAIVPDNSAHQAPLLQSPDVVNQWISKDLLCDALIHMGNIIPPYSCVTLPCMISFYQVLPVTVESVTNIMPSSIWSFSSLLHLYYFTLYDFSLSSSSCDSGVPDQHRA